MNTAIILAAGKGTRMNMGMNKIYLNIKGKTILAHTLDVFFSCSSINEIILVIGAGEEELCREKVLNNIDINKPFKLVTGGKERQDSVYNGIRSIDENSDLVLIHDGARPFITADIIDQSIEAAKLYKAAVVGVPVKDTVKEADGSDFIVRTPERSSLWLVQTPQTFLKNVIVQAYELSIKDRIPATDDSMLVERMGIRVKMVTGSYDNIKITTPEDIAFALAILESGR